MAYAAHDRAAEGEGMVVSEYRRTVELPCGAVGAWDNTGYRCRECLAIYGSIGCQCTPPKPQGSDVAGAGAVGLNGEAGER